MSPEFDLQAAFSDWASRATQVREFATGEWKAAIYEAHPSDVESEVGRLVCAVSHAERFRGFICVRVRSPQLCGVVILEDRKEHPVTADSFPGGVAELERVVTRELISLSAN